MIMAETRLDSSGVNDASLAGSRGRDGPASTFRDQIARKEREMAQLAEARLIEIEDENERLRNALQERNSAVDRLKVDFEYNLSLIHDRDGELARLEAERDQLQQSLEDEQLELKRMRTSSDEREAQHRAELLSRAEEVTNQTMSLRAKDEETRRLESAVEKGRQTNA